MVSEKTYAVVRTRFTAEHRWEDAPREVDFLRKRHRHEFHLTVKVEQFHDDRDVEYIMLKRKLDTHLEDWPQDKGESSCEMMAKDILQFLKSAIGAERHYVISVTEDGENGAEVHYET